MPLPSISAIICTHNRDVYLGKAIDSLLAQALDNVELLVVDNASTDTTAAVVQARLSDSRLRYVHESTLGLSVARNRGVQETKGDILAYLDDDAIASPQWLQEIQSAYAQNDRLGIAGGKVTLIWPQDPPRWISENMQGPLGHYDLGSEPLAITQPSLTPRGLNYSIRRTLLQDLGGFDLNLGRVGTKLLSNEELYMTELALQAGWQVQYLPKALVAHHVAPERLKPGWFLRRSWWQGVSEGYRDQHRQLSLGAKLLNPLERIARGGLKSLRYIRQPDRCFDNLLYCYGQLGYLSTLWTKV